MTNVMRLFFIFILGIVIANVRAMNCAIRDVQAVISIKMPGNEI